MEAVLWRVLRLLGAALLLGALWLRRGPAGRDPAWRLLLAAGAGMGAALLAWGAAADLLRLAEALGAPPGAPRLAEAARLTQQTAYGRSLLAATILGALLAASLPWSGRGATAVQGALAAALAGALALGGHAATAAQPAVAVPLQAVHTAATAAWLGGLVHLAWAGWLGRDEASFARAVAWFARGAAVAVAVTAATGAALALGRFSSLHDLRETAYGQMLLLKLWWLGAALGVAALNRLAVVRLQAAAGPAPAAARAGRLLRVLVPVEAALLAGVTVAAAGLAQTTPPAGPVLRYVVTMDEYAFTPARLEIPAGRRVRVVVHNRGREVHDWSVPNLPFQGGEVTGTTQHHPGAEGFVHVHVPPGGWAAVEFVALRPGRYRVLCTVWPHAERGMVGELVVRGGP